MLDYIFSNLYTYITVYQHNSDAPSKINASTHCPGERGLVLCVCFECAFMLN